MQVANALNNQIRILYNPSVEDFRLFDFLIVKSNFDKYLAQIIEIYDDKFDSSQNVAKIKLFYKISQDNEVLPYDNFTPNKECEIIKVKQNEVEDFINNNKKTFVFGKNVKSSLLLNLQYELFENNPIILADKIDCANNIILNLAKNLSNEKNVVIIDSTGILEYKNAKKIKASADFRMPLNYTTIEYIFDRCLENASLEFQSVCLPIINEIKKYAQKQENEFIPFNSFLEVLLEQYGATPYPELKILVAKMRKIQMDCVFARGKKDKENLINTIKNNKITILDLSKIKTIWQKAYLDYITDAINNEVFLITRLNEENCDVDLINKIYTKSKSINLIPHVSYNYKKLPTIVQFCKNYILLPSLCQRSDFLDANFALNNLLADNCLIFGENTDNFIYLAGDFEISNENETKKYRKIALSLLDNDEKMENNLGEKGDYFENIKKQNDLSDSEKLLKELSDLDEKKQTKDDFQQIDEVEKEEINLEAKNTNDEFQQIDNYKEKESEIRQDLKEVQKEAQETEKIEEAFEKELEEIEVEVENETNIETLDEINLAQEQNITIENEPQEINIEQEAQETDIQQEEASKEIIEQNIEENTENIQLEVDTVEFSEENNNDEALTFQDELTEVANNETQPEINVVLAAEMENIKPRGEIFDEEPQQQTIEESPQEEQEETAQEVPEENELSDDDLDFFQLAKESSIDFEENNEQEQEKIIVDNVEYNTSNNETDNTKKDELAVDSLEEDIKQEMEDDIDLDLVAQNSIDNSFNDIINTKNEIKVEPLNIENAQVGANIISSQENDENLPIFKEQEEQKQTKTYKTGEIIEHSKYGKGTIVKIVKYEERQLLQIEFDEFGKKLLDPAIANIKSIN